MAIDVTKLSISCEGPCRCMGIFLFKQSYTKIYLTQTVVLLRVMFHLTTL
jgi:hypothetical protein